MAPYGAWLQRTNGFALIVALLLLAAGAQARPVRMLILGDSLTAGYGLSAADGFQAQMTAALRARGHDVQLIDGAVSGDTSAGGRARLEWAVGDGVDAAVVELGANDMLRGVSVPEVEANLTAILDALAAKHIPVLLTGMEAIPNLGADYGAAFRAMYARLGRRPGVVFDPFFLEGVAADRSLNQADGIHPNAVGVKKEVQRLVPVMEQLLSRVA